MKFKNLANYTTQNLEDIVTQVKAMIQLDRDYEEYDSSYTITIVDYRVEEDDENKYYEVYESELFIENESTFDEVLNDFVRNEQLVKTYKTRRGLMQAFLNDDDVKGIKYRMHTVI